MRVCARVCSCVRVCVFMPECVWVLMCGCVWVLMCECVCLRKRACVYLCVRTCLCLCVRTCLYLCVHEKKESKRAHFRMDRFCYHRILSNALITSSAKGIESITNLYSGSSKSKTETNIYSKNFVLGK